MTYKRCNSWIAASTTTDEAGKLARRLVRRCGMQGAACLLASPTYVLQSWCRGGFIRPRDRRLIWLLYAVMMHPEMLRTPFDILTSGRYLPRRYRKTDAGEGD